MYISELKEHVIIQGKAQSVSENGQFSEEVGHLIIDGQVICLLILFIYIYLLYHCITVHLRYILELLAYYFKLNY